MALKPVEVIAYFEDLSGVLSRPLVVDFDPIVSIEGISVRR